MKPSRLVQSALAAKSPIPALLVAAWAALTARFSRGGIVPHEGDAEPRLLCGPERGSIVRCSICKHLLFIWEEHVPRGCCYAHMHCIGRFDKSPT